MHAIGEQEFREECLKHQKAVIEAVEKQTSVFRLVAERLWEIERAIRGYEKE